MRCEPWGEHSSLKRMRPPILLTVCDLRSAGCKRVWMRVKLDERCVWRVLWKLLKRVLLHLLVLLGRSSRRGRLQSTSFLACGSG